ncbi:MAG TPA: pyrroline-5-carboxylate reductase [Caulobacteraceae bacterium]|jgi:pyrroline-5-carboxylate reductase|nr:pyrroline-5-carboxylate reductase [Caulobacteraceae bacterium]
MTAPRLPILIAGAGAMGGSLIAGWRRGGTMSAADMIIVDPEPGEEALSARDGGAQLNPAEAELARANLVLLAVKPQIWRTVAAVIAPHLAPQAAIVSVAAGVRAVDLTEAFGGRSVAQVMPSLAAAIGQGSAAVWSADPALKWDVQVLFTPLGVVTALTREDELHVATAAGGSAPAYLYAFVEALEGAAVEAGLAPAAAASLVRATITGAAALLRESGEEPAALRARVTSPGGTTAAALKALGAKPGLSGLMKKTVAAAVARSKELGE